MQVSMVKCKKRLAMLWLAWGGFLFFLLLFQTIFGRYQEKAGEAWSWMLPTIMPTLSLIITVWAVDALQQATPARVVDRFFFGLSFGLSSLYLLVVTLIIVLPIFVSSDAEEALKQMKASNIYLGPSQGLVSIALGVFFTKKEKL
jgi:hypothetical protein